MDEVDPAQNAPPRRRWRMRVALVAGTIAGLAVLGVWSQRRPIADSFVRDALAQRGVQARYRLVAVGLNRQLLRDVVIGAPGDPDLVARSIAIDTRFGLGGVELVGAAAEGLRLRGRLVNGTLRLGEIDKLLPPPSGRPFTLPEIAVALADARMRLETPAGVVALRVDGSGRLDDGFAGRIAATGTTLAAGGCTLAAPRALLRLRITDRAPRLVGPMAVAHAACAGARAADARVDMDVTFGEAIDRWRGTIAPRIGAIATTAGRFDGVHGTVRFDGARTRTEGTMRIEAARFATAGASGAGLGIAGAFLTGRSGERFDGSVAVRRARLPDALLARIAGSAGAAAGTPAGPLVDRVAAAAADAGRALAGRAAVSGGRRGGQGWLAMAGVDVRSARGARLTLAGGDGVRVTWPDGAIGIDGTAMLSGGGLPALSARLHGSGGAVTGIVAPTRYTAGDAALALGETRFAIGPRGEAQFATVATISGPLGDGAVDALQLPLAGAVGGDGSLALNPDCSWIRFRQLRVSGLTLDPARLRLCPVGGALVRAGPRGFAGGARVAAPRLAGRLGSTPITLAAAGSSISLDDGGFAIDGLAARLARQGAQTRLDFAKLDGRARDGGVGGSFAGGGGQIANVPLILDEAAGSWQLADGVLDVRGATGITDAQAEAPRFRAMRVPDVALRLADNTITATGTLTEPATGTGVSDIAIVHRLGAGSGEARLAVPGIAFTEALQPEQLTPLTLGVVANVRGSVSGEGRIAWSDAGVTSTGRFATAGMDLAAAFGPVTDLSTELVLTDLLGLVSAPDQLATIGAVNPGIAVEDGQLRYRLLEGQRVGIAGGRWPFAGGSLVLEPTTLDFGQASERRLTFTVTALDAAKFLQAMEFENIAATGIFDGTLPMIFGEDGGRIEGGSLTVRPGGGTLAYVGEVSNADLGMFAKLAFDALKSIRYDRLTIDLDGALDGEIVTRIRFNGVNQGTPEAQQSALMKQFTGLPFRFNITVRAPFRGLVSTARSFSDPTGLVRDQLAPKLPPNASSTESTVQPQESEPVP